MTKGTEVIYNIMNMKCFFLDIVILVSDDDHQRRAADEDGNNEGAAVVEDGNHEKRAANDRRSAEGNHAFAEEEESDNTEVRAEETNSAQTSNAPVSVHQNPRWLKILSDNFKEEIVNKLSSRVKYALESDEYIEVVNFLHLISTIMQHFLKVDRDDQRVKNEVLNTVIDHLKNKVFGTVCKPGKSFGYFVFL